MKKIVTLISYLFFVLIIKAQPPKVVAAFLLLNSDDRAMLHIKYNDTEKKWVGYNTETDLSCSTSISENNTYLEIKDEGTGGGATTICIKLLPTNDSEKLLLVTKQTYDGIALESSAKVLSYTQFDTKEVDGIVPTSNIKKFTPSNLEEKMKPYYEGGNFVYLLNQQTNTLKIKAHFLKLRMACINDFEPACDADNKNNITQYYQWNGDKKAFVLIN